MSPWPEVALREVLRLDLNKVDVDPSVTYPMVGVYSFGRGLFDREPVEGSSTSYRFFYRLDADHIVMSQLFGWEGALAVSSNQFAGKFLSPQFPTFRADAARLDPNYLGWFMRRPAFWEELGTRTKGMGDRRRTLNPEALLVSKMPLPPVEEQRRMVHKIRRLSNLVGSADRNRSYSRARLSKLFASALHHAWLSSQSWQSSRLGTLVRLTSGQVDPTSAQYLGLPHINGEYMESGTGRLLPGWRSAADDGVTSGKYLFRAGAVLYSKIRPYLRKAVVVPFEGLCSADVYATDWIDPSIEAPFLRYAFLEPRFTSYVVELSGRTRMPKVNMNQLLAFDLRFPAIQEQRRIVARLDLLSARLESLRGRLDMAQAEMDSLTPAALDRLFR